MASLGAGSGLLSDVDRGMPGRVNRFCLSFFANRAGVGLDANILTGGSGRDLALAPAVPLGWNLCLCNDDRMTDGAVLAFRLARLRAGWGLCCIDYFCVALGGDHFLRNEDFVADRAADAIRQTRFGAGRRLARNSLLGVAGRGNHFLRNENLVANGAVLAFGQTSLSAGWSLCCIDYFCVAGRGDFFLGNEYSIADRAVLALGQTSLRAGRSLCCIDYFCVAGRRDFFHTGEDCRTNGALRTGRMTSLGAGSGLFRNFNRSMSSCVDCFGLGCIANCAGVGLDAGILTGRRGRDLALIPTVALGGNLFLRFDNRSADRAADAIRQTRFGTGCGLAHNGLLSVTGSRDHFLFNNDFVANRAMLTFGQSSLRAGWSLCCIDYFCVALGLNGFTLGVFLAADGADRITGVAVLGAGGILLVDHLGERMIVLPLGIKSGVHGQINSRTIRIGVASTIGCRIPVQEVVAFTGKRVCVQCGIRLCIYGLWGHRAFDRVFYSSVGFKGNRQLDRLFAAPNAIDIVDNIASVCGRSFGVRAVCVVQLGGSNIYTNIFLRILVELIGFITCTGCANLSILTSSFTGSDIGTRCRRVNSALNCQHAVYIDLSISNPSGPLSRR